jgi:hypothetical protein
MAKTPTRNRQQLAKGRLERRWATWDMDATPQRTEHVLESDVILEVDVKALLTEMGQKALRAKSGRATAMRGIIVAKRTGIARTGGR